MFQRLDARLSHLVAAQDAFSKARNDWAAKVNFEINTEEPEVCAIEPIYLLLTLKVLVTTVGALGHF